MLNIPGFRLLLSLAVTTFVLLCQVDVSSAAVPKAAKGQGCNQAGYWAGVCQTQCASTSASRRKICIQRCMLRNPC